MNKFFAAILATALISSHVVAQEATEEVPENTLDLTSFQSIYSAAYQANLDAQRALAEGYSVKPVNDQKIDPLQGCVWATVIVRSGHKELRNSDTVNQKTFCGHLSQEHKTWANSEAQRLLGVIYKR